MRDVRPWEEALQHAPDVGCEVSSSCLECPLPHCKYDDPDWHKKAQQIRRQKEIQSTVQLLFKVEATGLIRRKAAVKVAEQQGIDPRTVFRRLKRYKEML